MPVTSSLQNEWRFPPGGDTLSLRDVQYSPSRKENATHGQVYRIGRPRVKLHGGRGGPERATVALAGGGDERRGADPGAEERGHRRGALVRMPSVWRSNSGSGPSSGRSTRSGASSERWVTGPKPTRCWSATRYGCRTGSRACSGPGAFPWPERACSRRGSGRPG